MIYETLGVRRVINGAAAQSRLGGSTMSRTVAAAMSQASRSFVDVSELHDRVGERIAQLTYNEAACVSCGAAAGVMVAVAACLAGRDPAAAAALPGSQQSQRPAVAVWRPHAGGTLAGADQDLANGYLAGVEMAGARVQLVDDPSELSSDQVCLLWFVGPYPQPNDEKTLDRFLDRAHEVNIPVIVDAADQFPPASNLWHYTRDRGADLALFSGGKGLRGPSASGLILGRASVVAACRTNSGPEHSIGRPAKVGKEELVGLLIAVEEAIDSDATRQSTGWSTIVDGWLSAFQGLIPLGVRVRRVETSHSGQPIPRVILTLPAGEPFLRDAIIDALWERSPRIAVLPEPGDGIALNPQMLDADEADQLAHAIVEEITVHLAPRAP